jgi:N,N'-diacetylchitobiose transport system substrate-binding protein
MYWAVSIPFLYDTGGSIAKEADGKWSSQLGTPESLKGLENWKEFQNTYSTEASRSMNMDAPPIVTVFGTGQAGMIFDTMARTAAILNDFPDANLGTFSMPSAAHPDEEVLMPVMLGGSDLAIPAKSAQSELALEYLRIWQRPEIQSEYVALADVHLPTTKEMLAQVTPTVPELMQPFHAAGEDTFSTPATPGWTSIEGDESFRWFFEEIATSKMTPSEAAADFGAHLETVLNETK